MNTPLDDVPLADDCDCEFADSEEGESWHYLRRCWNCSGTWHSLHCPHDGVQGRCAHCGERGAVFPTPTTGAPDGQPPEPPE